MGVLAGGRVVAVALAATIVAGGCAVVERELPFGDLGGGSPRAVVGRALSAMASGDLAGVDALTCAEDARANLLPAFVPFRFGLAAAPSVADADVLTMVDMDLSGLAATERLQDPETAFVEVEGPVVLHYDLDRVRTVVTEAAGADAAETALAVLGDGVVTASVHGSVMLTRVDGRWRMCGNPAE